MNRCMTKSFLPAGFDLEKQPVVMTYYKSIHHQVGTLGGGNHFIELQRDEEGWLWIMIHSGSRNLGKQVGDFYNKRAKWFNELYYSKVESELMLPFLPLKTHEFADYWGEMILHCLCQVQPPVNDGAYQGGYCRCFASG